MEYTINSKNEITCQK